MVTKGNACDYNIGHISLHTEVNVTRVLDHHPTGSLPNWHDSQYLLYFQITIHIINFLPYSPNLLSIPPVWRSGTGNPCGMTSASGGGREEDY